jgi:hypothetical protein
MAANSLRQGGVVHVPAGAYTIMNPVRVPTNVTLRFDGGARLTFSRLGRFEVGTASALVGEQFGLPRPERGVLFVGRTPGLSPIVVTDGAVGCRISGIGLLGAASTPLGPAIRLDAKTPGSINRCYLTDMSVIEWKGTAVSIVNSQDNHFTNLTISGAAIGVYLGGHSNSNQFVNLQIDSASVGVQEDSDGANNPNLFLNLKIDANSAAPGARELVISSSARGLRVTNFDFRADAHGTGDCISITGPASDVGFVNGGCWRVESPAGVGLNVASAVSILLSNVSFQGFAIAIQDSSPSTKNSYSQISISNCLRPTLFTGTQPINIVQMPGGCAAAFYQISATAHSLDCATGH